MENKADKDEFDNLKLRMSDDLKTVKYATQDNFRQLLATDNYIEKYQSFFILTQISDALMAVISKEKRQKLKEFEHVKFREWHK